MKKLKIEISFFDDDFLAVSIFLFRRNIAAIKRLRREMKTFGIFRTAVLAQFCFMLVNCSMLGEETRECGELRLSFDAAVEFSTRAMETIPDTSDFLLNITNASGKVVFNGKFGDCPEKMEVSAGSYTVKVQSEEFDKPAFAKPQYGDEVCVIVPSGGKADVKLSCAQINAGVQLKIDKNFLSGCPDGSLHLKSDQGKLLYSYSEKRIAYFQPGRISLIFSQGGKDEVLLSRDLQARQVLVLGVSVAQGTSDSQFQGIGGVSVSVDTSKVWLDDNYVIGGVSSKGTSCDNAMTVAQAKSDSPQEGVWVSGYIVGGDLTSASASFNPPFKSQTNILLGPKSSTTDREVCIAVQLPAGAVRDALNLVSNPDLRGRKVCLRGDVVDSYFGLVGLKSVDDYVL